MTTLPDNARYAAIINPDETDLKGFFDLMRRQLREYPDRPLVAIIYRKMPEEHDQHQL